jgi:hypothetical protein
MLYLAKYGKNNSKVFPWGLVRTKHSVQRTDRLNERVLSISVLNNHRLKAVGFLAAESRVEAKAS